MLNLFITSPLRKSGKTTISAGLAATLQSLGYLTCLYKPIQIAGTEKNGFTQSPDIAYVKSIDPYINSHFTYLFKTDAEPIIAAEEENEYIDIESINLEYKKFDASSDCTIIDSEGSLMSPVAPNILSIDIAKKLQLPILIVTTPNNDSVTTTLASIDSAISRGVDVRGVIINNVPDNCSKLKLTSLSRIIEEYTNVKILGLVQHIDDTYSPQDLISACLNGIDIESVFDVKIEKLDLN